MVGDPANAVFAASSGDSINRNRMGLSPRPIARSESRTRRPASSQFGHSLMCKISRSTRLILPAIRRRCYHPAMWRGGSSLGSPRRPQLPKDFTGSPQTDPARCPIDVLHAVILSTMATQIITRPH